MFANHFSIHGIYWLNAALIVFAFYWAFGRQRIYSMLWGALGTFHLLAYLDFITTQNAFKPEIIFRGQAIILLGNGLFLLSIFLFDKGPLTIEPKFLNKRLPTFFGKKSAASNRYLLLMLVAAAVAIAIQFKNGLAVANTDWSTQRLINDRYSFRPVSTMLGFVSFSGFWVAIRSKRIVTASLFGIAIVVLFFVLGSRAMFATIAGAVFVDILTSKVKLQAKLTLLMTLGILGYGVHTLLRIFRGMGLSGFLTALATGNLDARLDGHYGKLGLGGEEKAYQTFYYVIEKDYSYRPYRSWPTPKRLALIYVPSSIASFKPEDITTQLWYDGLEDGFHDSSHDLVQLEETAATGIGGSIHPLFWGDAYANGHLAGVICYAFVLGGLAVSVDRLFLRSTELFFFTMAPCTCVGYLFIARGSVVAGTGSFLYSLPLVVILSFVSFTPLLRKLPGKDRSSKRNTRGKSLQRQSRGAKPPTISDKHPFQNEDC